MDFNMQVRLSTLFVVGCAVCLVVLLLRSRNQIFEEAVAFRRRLQFDGMFDADPSSAQKNMNMKRSKNGRGGIKSANKEAIHPLKKEAADILMNLDRYHLWWTGPPDSDTFKPATWGAMHTESENAIFTMAVVQGSSDNHDIELTSAAHELLLFLGTARRHFSGDIVIAIESGMGHEVKDILIEYKAVVYEISDTLCSKSTDSIFCGVEEERAPASVFRYYFYEKWASAYNQESLLMLADYRDIIFQANPFAYRTREWLQHAHLALFQEYYPNMIIKRCKFNTRVMRECYGQEALNMYGEKSIISSGASLGTRDAVLVWSHHITSQLQEAPGRLVDSASRCTTGGIDHAFINYLVYSNYGVGTYGGAASGEGNMGGAYSGYSGGGGGGKRGKGGKGKRARGKGKGKSTGLEASAARDREGRRVLEGFDGSENESDRHELTGTGGGTGTLIGTHSLRNVMNVRIFTQGDGAVNSLGGLNPNTVSANVSSGSLQAFWGILDDKGRVLNWNGEVSPAVHQLDHFRDDLVALAKKKGHRSDKDKDYYWLALDSAKCLWGCKST